MYKKRLSYFSVSLTGVEPKTLTIAVAHATNLAIVLPYDERSYHYPYVNKITKCIHSLCYSRRIQKHDVYTLSHQFNIFDWLRR